MKLSITKLKEFCSLPTPSFSHLPGFKELHAPEGQLLFKEFPGGKAKILAVCHLDTVKPPSHFACDKDIIFSPVLDDRLGAYTILDVLPQVGLEYDILLTDLEEKGKTTAKYFKPNKQYNWIFSFDRRGAGAVLYCYQTATQWKKEIKGYFNIPFGSFSCIASMTHLGCCGINVGTAYYDEHTLNSYALISEYISQINTFIKFFRVNEHTFFPYTYVAPKVYNYGSSYRGMKTKTYEGWEQCECCKAWFSQIWFDKPIWEGLGLHVCENCVKDDSTWRSIKVRVLNGTYWSHRSSDGEEDAEESDPLIHPSSQLVLLNSNTGNQSLPENTTKLWYATWNTNQLYTEAQRRSLACSTYTTRRQLRKLLIADDVAKKSNKANLRIMPT